MTIRAVLAVSTLAVSTFLLALQTPPVVANDTAPRPVAAGSAMWNRRYTQQGTRRFTLGQPETPIQGY